MQTTTILYIILALLLSLLIAFFQYFYKNKDKRKINILLFVLRTFSLFLIGLLFINPIIKTRKIENTKPILAVLVDNSLSTKYFKQEKVIDTILQKIKASKALDKKFKIDYFSFGKRLQVLDSLSFNASQTNISNAITSINELQKEENGAILLLSDGNQTIGNDYEFTDSEKTIYPIVLGDTTLYKDLKIAQLNVNKYSYIKNKFPVETILFYEGKEVVNTHFSIYHKGKAIFSKKVRFSPSDNVKTITANFTSVKEGLQFYTASIQKITDEKNIQNNKKTFSIEVINEQTKVLILTSILHPDLGVLKKSIESNKQRSVTIININKFSGKIDDFQLVVLYNLNKEFKNILKEIKNKNSNYLIISGLNTDWDFLNKQQLGIYKKYINQVENYSAVFNSQFLTFVQKDIGFNRFSPLKDKFGEIILSKSHQTMLYQQISGLKTQQPLLATFELNNQKSAFLFGEGIWKWRATSFLNQNSFKDFDAFISNLVQYLASNKKRSRLDVTAKSVYPSNSTVKLSAFYVDKNYKFDDRASLWLHLTNKQTKESKKVPFSLMNNSYQIEVENLAEGNYAYKVSVENQKIKKYGVFKVTNYKVEEQFTNANDKKLQKLADKTGGKLYYSNQNNEMIKEIVSNKKYFTTQKSTIKEKNLIDWKWILFIIITLLSTEWFVRKYHGKI